MYSADYNPRQVVLTNGRLLAMMVAMTIAALLLMGSALFNLY